MRTLIILVSIIGIASVVATIVVGTRTFDGTVVSDPYTEGLRWDDSRKARHDAGWEMDVVLRALAAGRAELQVRVTDRNGRPLEDANAVFTLGRPETDRYDRSYTAENSMPGVFRALVELPIDGPWDLRAMVSRGERTVILEKRIHVAGERR